jgi:hypothetical protein
MSDTRDRILARRAKFMAAAIVGITGCSSETSSGSPQPCLKFAPDSAIDAKDASDTQPQVCLIAEPPDSSSDTAITDTAADTADTSTTDTGPMPCLVPPLDGG